MAVGNMVIHGIESITIRSRLREIGEQLDREEAFLPQKLFEDVLELQRIGMYSKSIRFQAWDLLLKLMERRRTERIVDIILQWPSVEIQLLLRQLSVFKLSGWTMHPARFTVVQIPSESSHRLQPRNRDDDLAYSYRNVFGAVLKRDSRLLHDLFSVDEFVLIQTNPSVSTPGEGWGPSDATGSLDQFFDYLGTEHNSPLRRKWELPLAASDFIEFLSSGGREQVLQVLNYITTALRPFASDNAFPLPTLSLLARHSKLPVANTVHPAFSLLWFTLHLLLRSQIAIRLFEETKMLDILEGMYLYDFPGSSRDMVRQLDVARRDMRLVTCMILGVLSVKDSCLSLARFLRDERPRFFIEVFIPFVRDYQEIDAFRLPMCDIDPPDDRREFYAVFMDYLSSNSDSRAWDALLGELEKKRETFIVDALLQLSNEQLQTVLRQLVVFRLSGRGFHDKDWLTLPDALDISGDPTRVNYKARLATLRSIVLAIHRHDTVMVHKCIDTSTLAILQTDHVLSGGGIVVPDDYGFRLFFNAFADYSFDIYAPCRLPGFGATFIEFLVTAPPEEVKSVVQYVVQVVTPFLPTTPVVVGTEMVLDAHENLQRTSLLHPILPFLVFAVHLAYASSTAAQFFLDLRLPELLIYGELAASGSMNRNEIIHLQSRYMLFLGALSCHCQEPLLGYLQSCVGRFIDFVRPITLNVLTVQWSLLMSATSSYIDLTPDILPLISVIVPAPFPMPDGPHLNKHPWLHIIGSFREHWNHRNDTNLAVDDIYASVQEKWRAAEQFLLFAATVDEEHWQPLTDFLYRVPSGMVYMYSFIIGSYLSCPSRTTDASRRARIAGMGGQARDFLRRMQHIAETCGFTMVNPVDRFITMTSRATHGQRSAVSGIGMENMLSLLLAVEQGLYDLGFEPTEKQLEARKRECDWMRFQITTVQMNIYED
ncbi:hypothetical protein EUX98_g8451 [Antrodiella citrinella]|uniref:Uncharacterized protein n=1 Tax=Antrodiella citrinella TaxID=2447956 RepID=A0A4S4MDI9_9APHY|nr:hypothetical protein EUX98_g8451 [Antrodiella citrinella]